MQPRLDDPAEYKIIKKVYFKNDLLEHEELDPIEKLHRIESRQRNTNKTSR